MYLISFPPLSPEIGQFLWTTVIFLIVWLFLGKTAFKPIANGLKKRENDIQSALDAADEAKKEMESMKAENEQLLQQAREERSQIIKDAKDAGDSIVKDARDKAKEEARMIVENAKKEIENEKRSAIEEVKKEVGSMALAVAEQVLRENLKNREGQQALVDRVVQDMNQN